MDLRHRLLWIDGLAGLVAGAVTLLASGWLSEWYSLPQELLFIIGAANLLYGSYSTSLAMRSIRPEKLILLLVCANLIWAMLCLSLAIIYWEIATLFGLGHLLIEGLFVGGLARLEWRWRELLQNAKSPLS
jgi:hypothetical protein